MKTIVCYGDSNTWGWNPSNLERYGASERWTGVMRSGLGEAYCVIEEGLNGRTTVHDDVMEEGRNGKKMLLPCLRSHKPLDLVIFLLGTNDLKNRYGVSAEEIAKGIEVLISMTRQSGTGIKGNSPGILVVCPPPIGPLTGFEAMFGGGVYKSELLAAQYGQVAELHNCHFVNAGDIITSSRTDGIHWDIKAHRLLGEHLAGEVRRRFE